MESGTDVHDDMITNSLIIHQQEADTPGIISLVQKEVNGHTSFLPYVNL